MRKEKQGDMKKGDYEKEKKKGLKICMFLLVAVMLGGCTGTAVWYFYKELQELQKDDHAAQIMEGPAEEQLLAAWEQGDSRAFIRVFEEEQDVPEEEEEQSKPEGVRYLSDGEMTEILGEEWFGKAKEENREDVQKEDVPDLLAAMMRHGSLEIIGSTESGIEIKIIVPDLGELAGQIEGSSNEKEAEALRLLAKKLDEENYKTREAQFVLERRDGMENRLIASAELLDAVYGGLFTLYNNAMDQYYQFLYQMAGGEWQ